MQKVPQAHTLLLSLLLLLTCIMILFRHVDNGISRQTIFLSLMCTSKLTFAFLTFQVLYKVELNGYA